MHGAFTLLRRYLLLTIQHFLYNSELGLISVNLSPSNSKSGTNWIQFQPFFDNVLPFQSEVQYVNNSYRISVIIYNEAILLTNNLNVILYFLRRQSILRIHLAVKTVHK